MERAAWRRRATSKGLEDTEIGKLASIVSDELKGISGARIRCLRSDHYAVAFLFSLAHLCFTLRSHNPTTRTKSVCCVQFMSTGPISPPTSNWLDSWGLSSGRSILASRRIPWSNPSPSRQSRRSSASTAMMGYAKLRAQFSRSCLLTSDCASPQLVQVRDRREDRARPRSRRRLVLIP